MDLKQRSIIALVAVLVLVGVAWWLFWPPQTRITQGLDLRGGLSVILTAQGTQQSPVTAEKMDQAELIVRTRVDKLGASEVSIQRQGNDSILVQIPGVKDAQQALSIIGSTGQLEFVEVDSITDTATVAAIKAYDPTVDKKVQLKEGTYTPFMTGAVVRNPQVSSNPQTNEITVTLDMNAEGRQKWGEVTTRLAPTAGQIAIVLDGVVQSSPQVNEPILNGQTEISGKFTPAEAKNLRTVLQSGALPVTLEFSESRVVGPTLGQDSLRQGVIAALIGMAIVSVYLLIFYRGLGLTAVGALVVFASLFLGSLAALSRFGFFTLTLPGIAGIVLTIGLAADSSILVLERFKEEIRDGKTYRSAANSGTMHGILTSLDADIVTFVSALVLFLVAIGPVKGFALTLMIGIVFDIVTMYLYKRPIIVLLADAAIPAFPMLWGVPKQEAVPTKTVGKQAAKGGGARA